MISIKLKTVISILSVFLTVLSMHTISSAHLTAVSERTPAVRDAIVAAVSGIDTASEITEAHLAAITNLNLRAKGITEMKSGDFSGMTGLMNLNLHNNELSSLPDGIFKGLTALTTLRLGDNTVDPMQISVSLEKVSASEGQFKVVIQTGAPFTIVLPISVTNGSISGDVMTLTVAQGSVESETLTVTRTAGTTDAVSVNIDTIPGLPSHHYGYILSKSDTLPIEVLNTISETPADPDDTQSELETLTPPETPTPPDEPENNPPTFNDGSIAIRFIAENTTAGTNIGTPVAATDANDDTLTYTINGTDASSFDIDSTSGQLKTKAALDYEMNKIYVVTIMASDGSLTDSISVIVSIIDVSDTDLVSVFLPVSERTPQVRDAIVNAVPNIVDAANVTDTHLAAITSLNLRSAGITALKSGDFSGLSGLVNLNLYGNMLSSLPYSIFSGLTSLTTLRISGNFVDPLPIIVSLQQIDANEYRAVISTGAPFDVELPIDGADPTTMITIPKGHVYSIPFTASTSVGIGVLPNLPANHFGYVLSKSTVCNRTLQVTEAISNAVPGITDCRNLSELHLATITTLNLSDKGISSLSGDDFAGMLTLTSLDLQNNQLSSLPDGVFKGLTRLNQLNLSGNTVSPLPLTVTIEKVGENRIRAVVPTGAPFNIVLQISVENGFLDANNITIPIGSVFSTSLPLLRTTNTTEAVTVDFAALPRLPSMHSGYTLVKPQGFPFEIYSRINVAPVFTETAATRTIAENTPSDKNIGEVIGATDANNDSLTYTLSGTDATSFDIDSKTGQLKTKSTLDYETKQTYSVMITVSDGTLTDTINVTINVIDVDENRAPVFTDGDSTTREVAENTAAGENIGIPVVATDADDDPLTYSLGGTDANVFTLDTESGQLKTSTALDFESKSTYFVTITVSDGKLKDTINVTIGITDVEEKPTEDETATTRESEAPPTNNDPVFTEGDSTTREVTENTAAGENIGIPVVATDADDDTLTYSLGGTDASVFTLDTESGQLKTSTALDFESKSTYSVTITVSDGKLKDTINVTIRITDVEEKPTEDETATTRESEAPPTNNDPVFTEGDSTTREVAENTGSGVDIGDAVSATDVDEDKLTYILGGIDASSFSINSTTGQLRTSAFLDYEGKSSYSVIITVNDGNGGSDSISVTTNVTDVDETKINNAPEFASDDITRSVQENTDTEANIGERITATDADDDKLSYRLNGTDASSFSIDSDTGQLKTSAALNFESKSTYSVSVIASDNKGGSDSISVTINVTNVNEAPVFSDGSSTTRAIAENAPENINIDRTVSATDPDNDDLTYTLGGTHAALFSIDDNTGQLKTKALLDYEIQASYTVSITVSDGTFTDTITVTINVTDLDETPSNNPPVFTEGASTTRSVAENTDADENIGAPIAAKDADKNTLAYLLSGSDASSFAIDSTSGQLKTSAVLNHEAKASYTVTVIVSDGSGRDTISVTINVTDVNEAPVIALNIKTTLSIPENTAAGVNIGGTLSATDQDDGDTLTYSLGGTDAASFDIVSTSGQLQTKAALDYETKKSYVVTISVSDGKLTDTISVNINVADVDENRAPAFADGDSTTREVAENTGSGVDIGSAVSASDEDNDDLTYTLGGSDAASFSINSTSGQLRTKSALDFETKNSYSVTITVSDGKLTDTISVTINVTDVDENRAPTFADGDSTTREVAENTGSGVDIGSAVSATDEDNDDLTYTLGGSDAASFDIVSTSGQLRTKSTLDFEAKPSYSVTITASDGKLTDTISVTINVTDVDENRAPVFTDGDSTTREVAENTGSGEDIGSAVSATDEDNDDLTYTLGGSDAASFDIVSTSGQLQTKVLLDYEGKGTYSVTITVSDGKLTDTIAVTINVTDVDENRAPTFADGDSTTREVPENTDAGENIGTAVSATDADEDQLTYTLGGTDASSFDIVSNSGQLQTKVPLDYDAKGSYSVTIIVSDGKLTDTIRVTINVTDVYENRPPVFAQDSLSRSILIDSNTAIGTNIGAPVTATDPDEDDTLTYSVGGTDASFFSIVSTTGQLQTTEAFLSDTKINYSITVIAEDGNGGSDSVNVAVRAAGRTLQQTVNSPPSFTEGDSTTRSIAENTETGQNIGDPVTATDNDSGDTLTYTLGGTDASSFSIDSTNGQLQTSAALDYDIKSTYSVTVSVSDGHDGNDTINVTINVTEVDDGTSITPVSDRTQQVKDAIVNAVKGVDAAADITEKHLAGITVMNLKNKSISSLNSGDFSGMTSLNILHLQNNSLTSLPEDIFNGLSSLVKLYLENNALTSLPEDVFDGLSSVDNLWISENDLTSLPENLFDGMTALEFLHIEDNDLTSLPENIFDGLSLVWDLDIADNNISNLPTGVFDDLTDLLLLDLRNNSITDVSAVESLTSLSILYLNGNMISDYTPLRNLKEANTNITIDITIPVDPDAPVFSDGATTTLSVVENTPAGQNIGAAVDATDSTADDKLTYTLGGTDADSFSIVSTSGQLQTKAALDYETKKSHLITITVTDLTSKKDTIRVTINVTNVEDITPAISARTSQVMTAIIAAIEDVDSADEVTEAQLAAITHLFLSNKSISSLQEGDFAGMSSLRYLDLSGNSISSLPVGVFDDLSSIFNLNLINNSISDVSELEDLTTLVLLFLAGNSISDYGPLRRLIANSQVAIDITIPPEGNQEPLFTGRPIVGRLIAENTEAGVLVGTITATDADGDDLTYTFGGKDADSFTFESETAQIKTKAALDYESKQLYVVTVSVSDGNGGTDTITVHITVTNVSEISPAISERTSQVRNAIIAAIDGVDSADDVLDTQLAKIVRLPLSGKSISSLKVGDFAGMTGLTHINLATNSLSSLPEDLFQGLPSLLNINLQKNSITSLEEDVFDGLSKLSHLHLQNNNLTSLPEAVFEGLSSLQKLYLENNDLTSLPEDVFDGLSTVDNLWISENDLTSLHENLFDGMSSLLQLHLQENDLTSLPADIFDGLSMLWYLNLADNEIASLPTGVFDDLSDITILDLRNNSITDVSALENLTSLSILYLAGNTISDYGPLRTLIAAIDEIEDSSSLTLDITIPEESQNNAPTTKALPDTTALLSNYPNPFNPETWIPYQLAKPSDVSITIYSIRGTIVRHLDLGYKKAGYYTNRRLAGHWDGRNNLGERVANGLYFYQLQANIVSPLRKMVILK